MRPFWDDDDDDDDEDEDDDDDDDDDGGDDDDDDDSRVRNHAPAPVFPCWPVDLGDVAMDQYV